MWFRQYIFTGLRAFHDCYIPDKDGSSSQLKLLGSDARGETVSYLQFITTDLEGGMLPVISGIRGTGAENKFIMDH